MCVAIWDILQSLSIIRNLVKAYVIKFEFWKNFIFDIFLYIDISEK